MISSFAEIVENARKQQQKKLVIAAAEDEAVLLAVKNAVNQGFIEPILVGNKSKIEEFCKNLQFDVSAFTIIPENDPNESAQIAVKYVKENKAQLLMKGFVSTASLLKAVLDKEKGLKKSTVLSHVALFETPFYHKLLTVTDAAMNIAPTLDEKISIIGNAANIYHKLGCEIPKVAMVCPVETVNPKIESTQQAAILSTMSYRQQIKGCIIDGPLALDNAVSKEAAKHKGIVSEVAGDADIMVVHDIDAGNVLYKCLLFLGGAKTAAVIVGATVPIVLTSRADTDESKLYSIALASLLS
jgi:phosphate butyryltransferase